MYIDLYSDEMVITVHRWFVNKAFLGDWLYTRLGDLAARVTPNLEGEISKPRATADTKLVSQKKSIDTIAREVMQGKWGNGAERKK